MSGRTIRYSFIAKKPPVIKAVEIQSLVFLWCWRVILSLFDIDKRKILKLANTTFDKIFTFSKERQQPMKELKIDPKLAALFKPLEKEQLDELEEKLKAKYDGTPLYVWKGDIIVDGHNRYSICRKHNIDYTIGTLAYKTKEEVMRWMLDIQLGRRNLTPIQKIAATEKYRPIYEKQARENLKLATGGDRKSEDFKKNQGLTNLSKAIFGLLTLRPFGRRIPAIHIS